MIQFARVRNVTLWGALLLCALTARGDDPQAPVARGGRFLGRISDAVPCDDETGNIKDGTKLVESNFANDWVAYEAAELHMLERLVQPIDADVVDLPLPKFCDWLRKTHQLPAVLDEANLKDEQIPTDLPLSVKCQNVRLEIVLSRVLEPHDLRWLIQGESFVITTKNRAVARLESRVYSLRKVLATGFEQPALFKLLMGETTGSWEVAGDGNGTITVLPRDRILIRQTQPVQFELARLIRRLEDLE